MSLTPIFDATLADHPTNIWEASSIFPQPRQLKVIHSVPADPWTVRSSEEIRAEREAKVEEPAVIKLIKHLGQWVAA